MTPSKSPDWFRAWGVIMISVYMSRVCIRVRGSYQFFFFFFSPPIWRAYLFFFWSFLVEFRFTFRLGLVHIFFGLGFQVQGLRKVL